MEGIRIQSQAGESRPATAVRRAVSTANRLANLVRGHGMTRRLITFGHDFIVMSLPRWATKHGGNASQSVTGCPSFGPTTRSSDDCLGRWIGWIEGTHEEACSGDQCERSGAYSRARVAVSS